MAEQGYLSLRRLRIEDVPRHPEFTTASPNAPDLAKFLTAVFAEALKEDFQTGFTVEGNWSPAGKNITITGLDGGRVSVPVYVEQRTRKDKSGGTWFARRSKHLETDVRHTELDSLLMNDHSWYEYQYTPDLYDGNLLLEWGKEELEDAVSAVKKELGVSEIEMRGKSTRCTGCIHSQRYVV